MDGWKLVPVIPTEEMQESVQSAWESEGAISAKQMYIAMLAAAPVPPAGEVEVLRWQLKGFIPGVEGVSQAVFKPWVVLASDFDAHVTRLTAENARLQADKERLEVMVNNGLQANFDVRKERDALQSDLTKALELIEGATAIVRKEEASMFGSAPEVIKELRQYLAHQPAPAANFIACKVDESCGQDAEAAKGGSDE